MTIKLRRVLGLFELTFYGIGSIVGAGIYSVIGIAAGEVGAFLWLSFVGAGIAAFLTVLSYAELSSALTKAGAEYQYLKITFPKLPLFAFLAGYLVALNAAATAATVSIAFAGYLNVFISVPIIITAFSLLLICSIINISGIRTSTSISIFLICIEVAGLLLVIIAGFVKGELSRSFETLPALGDIGCILSGSALIFFMYIGFEDVVNLSEETIEANKTVPKALLISALITSILYVLIAIAVVGLSSPLNLSAGDAPLTAVANLMSPWMATAVSISALFATASTALIALISISRMLFGMARDGYLPTMFAKILYKQRTPYIAAIALFVVACMFLLLREIKIIAGLCSFGVLVVYIGIHVAVIVLRFNRPDINRPFKVPFSIGRLALLPVIGILVTLLLISQFDMMTYIIGIGAIILGVIFYYIQRYVSKVKNEL